MIVSEAINLPAPRLVDAIEELARRLHPEAFVERRAPGRGACSELAKTVPMR